LKRKRIKLLPGVHLAPPAFTGGRGLKLQHPRVVLTVVLHRPPSPAGAD
jgi:hypothetical protein